MPHHPALAAGRAAVVTGAASGIGRAAALRFAALGMKICLADLPGAALDDAAAQAAGASPLGSAGMLAHPADVRDLAQVQALAGAVYDRFGEVALLMNNAGKQAVAF